MSWIDTVRFDDRGLVPVVAQDARTGEVLMLAWANREALSLTGETRRAHYWSRSRGELWAKGDTSGNRQDVVDVRLDCDGDAVLYRVTQTGPACHTGERSCFYRGIAGDEVAPAPDSRPVLVRMQDVLAQRYTERPTDSYTTYLYDRGPDKILKKIGEEAAETIIAAKNSSERELAGETADLLFHLMALWEALGMRFDSVYEELERRFGAPPRAGSTEERPKRSSEIG
jgi:phosphoribosyl-AMP cyclohydrolase / phosphoribosyl-ATP pyrophosphohydrolase